MIFAYTVEKVLTGQKWQTRRIAKGETLHDGAVKRLTRAGLRTVYQVGKTYAVQPGRTQKAVARIEITGLRQETVAAISKADAVAEGFSSRDEFLAAWKAIHGQGANLSQEVWVITFKLDGLVSES